MDRLRRAAREPLVHFLFIGAGLLALDGLRAPDAEPAPVESVDDAPVRARLRAQFEAARGRPMRPDEETAALERYRDEEAMVDAALALGIHRTDPVVRRRLIQRMELLNEDTVELREPTDAELARLVAAHEETFPPVRTLAFEHRFFSRASHGPVLAAVAADAGERLRRGEEVAGEPFPRRLPRDGARVSALASRLGPDVAEAFYAAPIDRWSEPIRSAYGLHLVRVSERESRPPALADVRARARAMWRRARREEIGREMTAALRENGLGELAR